MKNLKLFTATLLVSFLGFTSCQDEIDNENGQNPNTNSADSQTASNLERSAMYDGSFDDFLDGNSCSSILFPLTTIINDTEITLLSQTDYSLVLNILGQITNNDDKIEFQFPLTVKLSNYTEVQVANQTEYDALMDACENAENEAENAINCLDFDFPITMLTYSLNFEQTGSVVIETEQQLYAYMNNFGDDELFSVSYPITATLNNDTDITITSDMDLKASINDCLGIEDAEAEAENQADNLETILTEGMFKVESFMNAGVNTANTYADYTIGFSNDLTLVAENTANATAQDIQGTYEVASETEVYLDLNFTGNATFNLLNNDWEVTSFNNTSIALKSKTDAAITLVLSRI
tara:strand:- start:35965 stop:37017 length:1053 start_codon:yes stop_codon:yes gene_type:complete